LCLALAAHICKSHNKKYCPRDRHSYMYPRPS
jgi:hypothetical protein